jgi:hypothetical protein
MESEKGVAPRRNGPSDLELAWRILTDFLPVGLGLFVGFVLFHGFLASGAAMRLLAADDRARAIVGRQQRMEPYVSFLVGTLFAYVAGRIIERKQETSKK